jgi:DNA phosphorothioation-associated putative methyltransferase
MGCRKTFLLLSFFMDDCTSQSSAAPKPAWIDFTTWQTPRWKTALRRKALSMPMRLALEKEIVNSNISLLDFGTGHGTDIKFLTEHHFIQATGFDGFYAATTPLKAAHVVSLIYVLNTIERDWERVEVLKHCWSLASDALLVAVQPQSNSKNRFGEQLTSIGTFQKYFTQPSLIEFVASAIDDGKICSLASGVIVIRR